MSPSASLKNGPSAPCPVSAYVATLPTGNVPPLKAALVAVGARLACPEPVSDQSPSPCSFVPVATCTSYVAPASRLVSLWLVVSMTVLSSVHSAAPCLRYCSLYQLMVRPMSSGFVQLTSSAGLIGVADWARVTVRLPTRGLTRVCRAVTGAASTVMARLNDAWSPSSSVAVYVSENSPASAGVPPRARVPASKVIPWGRPVRL